MSLCKKIHALSHSAIVPTVFHVQPGTTRPSQPAKRLQLSAISSKFQPVVPPHPCSLAGRYVAMRESRMISHSAIAPMRNDILLMYMCFLLIRHHIMDPFQLGRQSTNLGPTLFKDPDMTHFPFRCYVTNGKPIGFLLVPWCPPPFS